MTQSVELLLDPVTEDAIRSQWALLADAGLPSEQRADTDATHRPHITMFAGGVIEPGAEAELHTLVRGLDLDLVVGALTVFGPRHGRCILVRQVVASTELLRFQAQVTAVCSPSPDAHFVAGTWVPHVTLAHRIPTEDLGEMVSRLGEHTTRAQVTQCRRWDGDSKVAWMLGDR